MLTDHFARASTNRELEGIFSGVIQGLADTGDLIVRGITGPLEVVMPASIARPHDVAGAEITYRCRLVDGGSWAVITRFF